jgi:hypothetical protein
MYERFILFQLKKKKNPCIPVSLYKYQRLMIKKMKMKLIFAMIVLTTIGNSMNAQIPKMSIVEHFTNSNCGICANTNPTFYIALSAYPNVLHIAFHPSAPYASCVFSQANKIENDARTNYYGIFGGTPKFIVNGTLGNVSNITTTLNSIANETSNFSITTTQTLISSDSVNVTVVIKKIANDSLPNFSIANLFVGVVQDTVNQTTGNGESIHQDVFRKGLTNMQGNTITLPNSLNDSVVFNNGYKILPTWIGNQLRSISVLQEINTQKLIQSNQSSIATMQQPSGLQIVGLNKILIYPNPTNDFIIIENWQDYKTFLIITQDGRQIKKSNIFSSKINIQDLPQGVYTLKIIGKTKGGYANFSVVR